MRFEAAVLQLRLQRVLGGTVLEDVLFDDPEFRIGETTSQMNAGAGKTDWSRVKDCAISWGQKQTSGL